MKTDLFSPMVRMTKMCQEDMNGATAVEKMAPIDLLNAELPQTFNLFKKKKNAVSVAHNQVRPRKTRCVCIHSSSSLLSSK